MPNHHTQRLPHLTSLARHPIVFLTTATHDRRSTLTCDEAHEILRRIWRCGPDIDGWVVGRYVLMPDHVHLFARATPNAKPLAGWVQGWKSLSSRRLATALNVPMPLWQKDYFDRFLRSADSYGEKWDYVVRNPVRSGLARTPEEWRWQGVLADLEF